MCNSCFMIFANELLLAVSFICILDYRNDVRQKNKSKRFSYSSSKWAIKQQRQLTSTMHLDQKLLMNVQCSGGIKSSAKETRAFKMRSRVASHWKLTMISCESSSSKLIIFLLHEKFLENSVLTILWPFSI